MPPSVFSPENLNPPILLLHIKAYDVTSDFLDVAIVIKIVKTSKLFYLLEYLDISGKG